MRYQVVLAPTALAHLDDIRSFLAGAADPETAGEFVRGIIAYARTLSDFPRRGTPRDDLGTGVRTVAWRHRVTIAYSIEDATVLVAGVFYGGRGFDASSLSS